MKFTSRILEYLVVFREAWLSGAVREEVPIPNIGTTLATKHFDVWGLTINGDNR